MVLGQQLQDTPAREAVLGGKVGNADAALPVLDNAALAQLSVHSVELWDLKSVPTVSLNEAGRCICAEQHDKGVVLFEASWHIQACSPAILCKTEGGARADDPAEPGELVRQCSPVNVLGKQPL